KDKFGAGQRAGGVQTPHEIEEPIWKAVREKFVDFQNRWHGTSENQLSPLAKGLIALAAVVICINFPSQVMSSAVPLAVVYGVYYVVWASFIRPGIQRHANSLRDADPTAAPRDQDMTVAWHPPVDTDAPATPASRYAEKVRRRRMRPSWREVAYQQLAAKPARERFTELLASMLMAALVASMAALIAPLVLGMSGTSQGVAVHLWLAIVG